MISMSTRRVRRATTACLLAAGAFVPTWIAAQDISVGGQIRPRFEQRQGGSASGFTGTSMRVRAHVDAAVEPRVRVFLQFQDVRLWGEEKSTLGDFRADNLDLHQGFVEITPWVKGPLAFRVGRQEMAYGGERLIGAVGWAQQGRSFDGLRGLVGLGSWDVSFFGAQLAENDAPDGEDSAYMVGAYTAIGSLPFGTMDLYAIHNRIDAQAQTSQTTLGFRGWGKRGGLSYRLEAAYQGGSRIGTDVSAYMMGARLGTDLWGGRGGIALWYDHLSGGIGGGEPKLKVFDTLFATNHKFYGFADLFLNIPVHTGGRGLRDAAVKTRFSVAKDVTLRLDLHAFQLANADGLASGRLAEEIDFTAGYRFAKGLAFTAGYSRVWGAEGMTAIGRSDDDRNFGYVMISASF